MSLPLAHKVKRPFRYRDAATTSTPGYLARKMRVYARLERMRSRRNVIPLRRKANAAG